MAETIFRYINGVLRPLTVNKATVTQRSVSTVRSSKPIPKFKLAPEHYRTVSSFTIPNVTCQLCGAKVFYYEHPSGARVLFDHLGPPWPKHPCYEASQTTKSKNHKTSNIKPVRGWKKAGWQPLFYEKHILLQSGSAVRVQARADHYQLIFEIPIAILRQRHLDIAQIKYFLMQGKAAHGKAWIQLHDGVDPFEITTTSILPSGKPVVATRSAKLTDSQLSSMTKLDVTIQCHHEKQRWYLKLSSNNLNHQFSFKEKTFEHLKASASSLEAWVSKPNKKSNRTVFFVDMLTCNYVQAAFPVAAFAPLSLESKVSKDPVISKKCDQEIDPLERVSIFTHSAASKLVRGTLGEDDISLLVDNRLFRLGETTEKIVSGKVKIFLRQVRDTDESNADYAIYIHKNGELISGRPRGYVSKLTNDRHLLSNPRNKRSNTENTGMNVGRHRAFSVTLISVDLSQDDKICLELTDRLQEYRLRLHSISETVREKIIALSLDHKEHPLLLVRRSEHSYQLHIDGQFVVMASDESFFDKQTSRRSSDISDADKTLTPTSTNISALSDCIRNKAHLERHALGAALLEAVKETKK